MTKIEEIIERSQKLTDHYADQEFDFQQVEKMMKEYAETYARKVLGIAARNVNILDNGTNTGQAYVVVDAYDHFKRDKEFRVDIDSILTLKLPEHED